MAVLCNSELWKRLRRMGFYRNIAVTKVLGCFQQAYSGPGLKFEERSKAMFLQQELVFADMGSDMFDVRVLLRRHHGSFPVRQLLDLVGMVDSRN